MDERELRYLQLLSRSFPTARKAAAEIINLTAVLNLPKGTEVYASDVHGEYDAFTHLLRNGSGSIRMWIDEVFGASLTEKEKRVILLYYYEELTLNQATEYADWVFEPTITTF